MFLLSCLCRNVNGSIWFPELVSLLLFDYFVHINQPDWSCSLQEFLQPLCKKISLAVFIAAKLFRRKNRKKKRKESKSLLWGKERIKKKNQTKQTWEIQHRPLRIREKKQWPKTSQAHGARTNKSRRDSGFREGMDGSLGVLCIQIQGCRQKWALQQDPQSTLAAPCKAGGLWGDPGQEQRGPSTPLSLSEVLLSACAPCAEREQSLSVQDSPFRRCLGLWNNRWCFYNLSEACSWVDGERQYLRTTGLQEVVKLLLPIYIFLTMLSLRSVSSFFFLFFNFIFISLLWQSVSPFVFSSPPLILPFSLWPIKL